MMLGGIVLLRAGDLAQRPHVGVLEAGSFRLGSLDADRKHCRLSRQRHALIEPDVKPAHEESLTSTHMKA